MTIARSHAPGEDEQAALWAARLDGSVLSAADRTQLDAWLAANPAHRTLLSTYCQFSADLEQQLPLLEGIRDELVESPAAAKTARSLPWLSRPVWAGAALMAVAAVVAVFLWPARPQNQFQSLATPVAHRETVTLVDGSRIELNARTALVVEVTADSRRVRLADGEAFFSVAKDPRRPFFVETSAGSVRVTGTQFNVRTESPATLEVTVQEGSVRVRPAGNLARNLTSGDRLVRHADHVALSRLNPRELREALAWRQGLIVFVDTPLREALARFGRYHGRNLLASDGAAGRTVGGTHRLDDLDGFLSSLEDALSLRVNRALDGSIRVEATANDAQP
jgi:transmembrane sensor